MITADQMRERWRRFFNTENRWRKQAEAERDHANMQLRELINAVLDRDGGYAQQIAAMLKRGL